MSKIHQVLQDTEDLVTLMLHNISWRLSSAFSCNVAASLRFIFFAKNVTHVNMLLSSMYVELK